MDEKQPCESGFKWCRVHKVCHPIDQFYRDSSMADGLMQFCIPEMRRRQVERHKDGSAQKSMRKYMRSAKGIYRNQARAAVKKAINAGYIKVPTHCQFGDALKYNGLYLPPGVEIVECLVTKTTAHHYRGYDQNQWLTVIFLCDKHHALCETEERS